MAQYKLTQDAFINNIYYGTGSTVTVADDLVPGPHMIPVDAAAKKRAKETGHKPDAVPDYVDQITGQVDVTKYGSSPQVNSGIMLSGEDSDMMGPDLIQP
jgi:hypothetical protein